MRPRSASGSSSQTAQASFSWAPECYIVHNFAVFCWEILLLKVSPIGRASVSGSISKHKRATIVPVGERWVKGALFSGAQGP